MNVRLVVVGAAEAGPHDPPTEDGREVPRGGSPEAEAAVGEDKQPP